MKRLTSLEVIQLTGRNIFFDLIYRVKREVNTSIKDQWFYPRKMVLVLSFVLLMSIKSVVVIKM